MYFKIFIPLIALIFIGCSIKTDIKKSFSYFVVFKIKQIAFADGGFLRTGKNYTNLQIFSAGSPVMNLEIGNRVCIENEGCLSKEDFNKRFLYEKYPESLLENVLNGRVIFEKSGFIAKKNGFAQKIEQGRVNIIYEVNDKKIYFKDRTNRILIKLTRIEQP